MTLDIGFPRALKSVCGVAAQALAASTVLEVVAATKDAEVRSLVKLCHSALYSALVHQEHVVNMRCSESPSVSDVGAECCA